LRRDAADRGLRAHIAMPAQAISGHGPRALSPGLRVSERSGSGRRFAPFRSAFWKNSRETISKMFRRPVPSGES
jgi:hypothetical protein